MSERALIHSSISSIEPSFLLLELKLIRSSVNRIFTATRSFIFCKSSALIGLLVVVIRIPLRSTSYYYFNFISAFRFWKRKEISVIFAGYIVMVKTPYKTGLFKKFRSCLFLMNFLLIQNRLFHYIPWLTIRQCPAPYHCDMGSFYFGNSGRSRLISR